jgi:hypothetical protein
MEAETPRLTRVQISSAIRSATYVLDLDAIDGPSARLSDLLTAFGLNEK